MAGMSERSARKWQCGPLPSETKTERQWRTRPDPFDGVWEKEILPLLLGEARRQAQGNDNYRVAGGAASRPVQRLAAAHPACCLIEKCYRNSSTWGPPQPALIPALQGVPPWARQPRRRPASLAHDAAPLLHSALQRAQVSPAETIWLSFLQSAQQYHRTGVRVFLQPGQHVAPHSFERIWPSSPGAGRLHPPLP